MVRLVCLKFRGERSEILNQNGLPHHLFRLMDQLELWPIVFLMWLWVTGQEIYGGGMLQLGNLPLSTLIGKGFEESNSHLLFLEIEAVDELLYCLITIRFLYQQSLTYYHICI